MSGHSKWATTKHKKAVIDARRAKSWAKLIKNIEVAAKLGGADLQGNPTLFDAVLKAKKTSVPRTTSTAPSSAAPASAVRPSSTPRSCTKATVPTASPS